MQLTQTLGTQRIACTGEKTSRRKTTGTTFPVCSLSMLPLHCLLTPEMRNACIERGFYTTSGVLRMADYTIRPSFCQDDFGHSNLKSCHGRLWVEASL